MPPPWCGGQASVSASSRHVGIDRLRALVQRLEAGKQDGVADAFRTGQQDDQAIDSESHTTGRRHAVLECGDEIGIHVLDFLTDLIEEHLLLNNRIVLLEQAGAITPLMQSSNTSIVVASSWVIFASGHSSFGMCDKSRLDQRRLDDFFEDIIGDLVVFQLAVDLNIEGTRS